MDLLPLLQISAADRKEWELRIKDFDEDDTRGLPACDEKKLRVLLRELQAGQIKTIPDCKLGGFGADIIDNINFHKVLDQDEIFMLLKSITFLHDSFPQNLTKQSYRKLEDLSKQLLSTQGSEEIMQLKHKHVQYCFNLVKFGYDRKRDFIAAVMHSQVKELLDFLKEFELTFQQGLSFATIQSRFRFRIPQYIKQQSQLILTGIVFCYFADEPVCCQFSEEDFVKVLINEKQLPTMIVAGKSQTASNFVPIQSIARCVQSLYTIINSFADVIEKMSSDRKRLSPEEVNNKKDLIKFTSDLAPIVNLCLSEFHFPKQIKFKPLLTPEEELKSMQLGFPEDCNRLYVIGFDDKLLNGNLYSSNCTKIEMEFQYPVKCFKTLEQLTNLSIESDIAFFLKSSINLSNHLVKLLSKCQNYNDVEYLAFQIYKQQLQSYQSNSNQISSILSYQLYIPWLIPKVNLRFLTHFIATFHYNGVKIYQTRDQIKAEILKAYIDNNETNPEGADESLKIHTIPNVLIESMIKNRILHSDVGLAGEFANQLIFYRLMSTKQLADIICQFSTQLMKEKLSEKSMKYDIVSDKKEGSRFAHRLALMCGLISSTTRACCFIDEQFGTTVIEPWRQFFEKYKTAKVDQSWQHHYISFKNNIENGILVIDAAISESTEARKAEREQYKRIQRRKKRLFELQLKMKKEGKRVPTKLPTDMESNEEDERTKAKNQQNEKTRLNEEQKQSIKNQLEATILQIPFLNAEKIEEFAERITGLIKALTKQYIDIAQKKEKSLQLSVEEEDENGKLQEILLKTKVTSQVNQYDEISARIFVNMVTENITIGSLDVYVRLFDVLFKSLSIKMVFTSKIPSYKEIVFQTYNQNLLSHILQIFLIYELKMMSNDEFINSIVIPFLKQNVRLTKSSRCVIQTEISRQMVNQCNHRIVFVCEQQLQCLVFYFCYLLTQAMPADNVFYSLKWYVFASLQCQADVVDFMYPQTKYDSAEEELPKITVDVQILNENTQTLIEKYVELIADVIEVNSEKSESEDEDIKRLMGL